MAQLYKMTLYVCDLEDSLSLDEIETLIKQDALDGISVNCICHFADSQIGEQVEWDDNIDLNRCGCPTSIWDKYFKPPKKPQTNADRVRAMSDEELAEFLCKINGCYQVNCPGSELCEYGGGKANGLKKWLQNPVEEAPNGNP